MGYLYRNADSKEFPKRHGFVGGSVGDVGRTSFVTMHVLGSPIEILPLQSGDRFSIISNPGGGVGLVSVTEYSPSPKITVVPAIEPGNELGEGLLPSNVDCIGRWRAYICARNLWNNKNTLYLRSLRTAVVSDEWKLDKQQTSHHDILDSFMLACCNYELPKS